MSDFDPQPIYQAVGGIFKDQRREIDSAIARLSDTLRKSAQATEQDLGKHADTLAELTDALIEIQEQGARDEDLEPLRASVEKLQIATTKIIEAVGTKASVDEHVVLTKWLRKADEDLSKTEAALSTLSKAVDERLAQIRTTPGPQGEKGEPGETPAPEAVAKALKADDGFVWAICGQKGEPGEPGKPGHPGANAKPQDVAKALKADAQFIEETRGDRGESGPPGLGIELKSHVPAGVYREGDFVQNAWGKIYVAVRDTAATPRKSDAWRRVGLWGMEFCGLKDEKRAYEPGDLVIDGGSLFGWTGERFKMLVQRGRDGVDGAKGAKGDPGKDGRHAPALVAAVVEGQELKFLHDDETEFGVDLAAIQHALVDPRAIYKQIKAAWIDEHLTDDKTVPMYVHRGPWLREKSYSFGQAVSINKGLYLCIKAQRSGLPFSDEYWRKLAGGGGGGSVGTTPGAASPFNVVALNLAIPRVGAAAGDTYFSFQDNLLRIWDAANGRWVIPGAVAGVFPDDTQAKTGTVPAGTMHWSTGSSTMWVWDGTGWVKSSGGVKHVADAAARIAYTPEYTGELVAQENDGSLWHFMPLPGGGPAQWVPVMPKPADDRILRRLEWDPTDPNRLVWKDDRDSMETVPDLTDLLRIPISRLNTGKLVYVINDQKLYEFTASPTAMTRTQGDWSELGGGGGSTVRVVNRAADLPLNTPAVPITDGDLAIVRFHSDAITPLNELFVARVEARPPVTAPQGRGGTTMADGSAVPTGAGLAVIAGLGTDIAIYLQIDPAVDISGGFPVTFPADQTVYLQYSDGNVDELNITAGTYADVTALHTGTQLVQQSTHHVRFNYVLGGDGHTYIYIVGSGGATIAGGPYPWRFNGPYPTATKPAAPVLGAAFSWVPVTERIFKKPLIAGADVPDPQPNDLQITTEAGHKEIKVWDRVAGQWVVIYSEDNTAAAIAAGNLFTGTAQEAGHGTAGAIDLTAMPAESALGATDKGHYWVFVGTPGHQIAPTEIGGAASAIVGQVLNVGDWIQVAEPMTGTYQYSVIPGDLLSKATAVSLFGLNTWVQGAYQAGTLVSHQGSIYKAGVPVLATDPAPDDPANAKWTKIPISAGVHNVPADNNLPTTAPSGDVYLVVNSARASGNPAFYVYDTPSAQWLPIGGSGTAATGGAGQPVNLLGGELLFNVGMPIGSITMWPVDTPPDGWLICNGSAFDGNRYPILYQLLGDNHTPDLQNQFIRGAGGPLDNFAKHQYTTARPRTAFTTDNPGTHRHKSAYDPASGGGGTTANVSNKSGSTSYSGPSGSHTHRITGGGDPETAPPHVYLWYIQKAEDLGIAKRVI